MRIASDIRLAGIGSWLPEPVGTEEAVARGWYAEADREASGMRAVRIAGELPAPEMAVRAARAALRRSTAAGFAADDFGALLHCATYHQGPDGWSAPHYVLRHTLDRPVTAAQIGPGCLGMLAALELSAHRLAADPSKDAVLITSADNFSVPVVDRWNSSKLFLLADGGAAAVVARREGFARLLSVASASAPVLEEQHRAGEQLFPPGITVGRSLNFEERNAHLKRRWEQGAAAPAVHFGDVVADTVDRVLEDAGTSLEKVARICHTGYARRALHGIYLAPLDVEPSMGSWEFSRDVGHVGAADPFLALEHLWTGGEVVPGDQVLLLAAGPGMEVACAVLEITAGCPDGTAPHPPHGGTPKEDDR
ncbi:3-oxoacyl-[acyl-carrier-protein] synthase-3 [Streptomyces sp. BpilaLS-43]|uniref:ketoacyl-ACP synthase III family protein n=1 Tax=Streptomyces sp. BpilaLS-43 TaxID=1839778 RepID=UPI00081B3C14|nr:ketoacyl-ACP synthase III family protein [Streptomyces sp. BpilaLS-43]SCD87245.1 3-oxoacyl-[acyl-carrier-protein] synthase-3 [Streptomyces sp. BpilaLS-43]